MTQQKTVAAKKPKKAKRPDKAPQTPLQKLAAKHARKEAQEDLHAAGGKPSGRKWCAVKTTLDGIEFDSKAEATRWSELRLLERGGLISGLEHHVSFPLKVGDSVVCSYEADFVYWETGPGGLPRKIVEDVKSPVSKTPVYELKKKLLRAIYGLEIRETFSGKSAPRKRRQ